MTTNNQIRPGNRAFEYLLNHYQPLDAKITPLVNVLPDLGDELYGYAQTGAELLPRTVRTNLLARLFTTFTKTSYSNQKDLLALCIFDLQLCIYFDAVFSYCGDKQLASLLADSLLYQATGYEASSPTNSQIWDEGTQRARGISKYMLSRQQFKDIGDIQAWVFGKEVSAILHGNAKDISIILGLRNFSIVVRMNAKNACAFSLYGTLPTEAEQRAFQASLEETNKQLTEMLNKIGGKRQ